MNGPHEPETTGTPALPRQRPSEAQPLFAGGDDRPDAYELLGEGMPGGEGVTWRALDHELRAPVLCAVKVLSRPVAARGAWPTVADRQRLEQQKRLLQHLALPHVVRVHEVVAGSPPHPRGRPDPAAPRVLYVVMEWIEGRTLREVAGGRPATSGTLLERLKYVSQLAAALAGMMPANANASLHRDVKPGNCVIHHRRGLVLIDVTTLRPLDDGFDAAGSHTPGYAAPEVLAAPRRARTVATEMYSLGAVAAFCLTGADPIDTAYADERSSWQRQLLAAAAEAGVADPEAFVRHLLAAVDREPARRPTDLPAWSDDLIRLALHPGAAARSGGGPVRRPRRRRLVAAIVAIAAVAAIGVGAAVANFAGGDHGGSNAVLDAGPTVAPSGNAVTSAPAAATATPTSSTSVAVTRPTKPSTARSSAPTKAPVTARGSITAPTVGSPVRSCAYLNGSATLSPGTTLILTKRNLDNPGAGSYAELVFHWDQPGTLTSWRGAQYFGEGDDSVGQRYEVGLRQVPMAAARAFHDAGPSDYGQEIAKQGKQLDHVEVARVSGDGPGGCPGP
jgi:serine/threonine protein kinase